MAHGDSATAHRARLAETLDRLPHRGRKSEGLNKRRKFGDQNYYLHGKYHSKTEAKERKEKLKNQGHLARILHRGSEYGVYERKRK